MPKQKSMHTTSEANPQLIDFMQHKLDSLAKWDLIQFFYRRPDLIVTAPKIASLIGRDLRKVDLELKEMADRGLLETTDQSGVQVYRLAEDRETRALVEQFLKACDNRQFREAAIYHTMSMKR
jgi:hypothetical protein